MLRALSLSGTVWIAGACIWWWPQGDSNPCLNEHWFMSLGQALETIETWRLDYNAIRPHSALGDVPPQGFEQLTLNRATAPILSS